jgi:hypothetical protein
VRLCRMDVLSKKSTTSSFRDVDIAGILGIGSINVYARLTKQ